MAAHLLYAAIVSKERSDILDRSEFASLGEARTQRDHWVAFLKERGYRWYKGGDVSALYWPPSDDLPAIRVEVRYIGPQ